MPDYETHEHDVLVIGAGGAGLRAAIEASAAGVSVGMICKSLLGKAHTVMAEGGIAAALANVDDRDNWKVHFADTMRGGQYVNNWRMAELHAKEAPDRVRELEAWGAVFDRTPDGRILQRNFGGHKYPRLAHVGDRTGLEMIRTLQDHGIHQGIDVHMEHTVLALLKDGERVVGACWLTNASAGGSKFSGRKPIVLATGGIGPRLQDHEQQLGIHRRRHCAGLRRRRGIDRHGVRAVSSHRHGLAAERDGNSRDRRRARRRRHPDEQGRQAFHVRFDIPDNYKAQTADNEEEGWRYCQGDKNARRPPELLTRDHVARCIVREIKEGRGSPHGGVFLDIAWIKASIPNSAEHIKRKLPSMYHQFKQLADIDITQRADGGRADDALRDGRDPRGCGHADVECARAVRGGRMRRRASTARTGSAAIRFRTSSFSANAPASSRRSSRRKTRPARSTMRRSRKPRAKRWSRSSAARQGRRSLRRAARLAGDDAGSRRHRAYARTKCSERSTASQKLWERARQVGVGGNREYNPGWHTALDLKNLLTVSEAITRAAIDRKESRGAQFRDDYPDKDAAFGKGEHRA